MERGWRAVVIGEEVRCSVLHLPSKWEQKPAEDLSHGISCYGYILADRPSKLIRNIRLLWIFRDEELFGWQPCVLWSLPGILLAGSLKNYLDHQDTH